MKTKQDNPTSFSIDTMIEKAKTIQDYATFMANLNKLSKKETKGYHPYFQYVRVLMGAVFAHGKGEFWMSRNIFNRLAVKCGVGQMSGSAFSKFEAWLKTRPEPWIRVEVPQNGSRPAMWVLTGLLGAALDRALGELLAGLLRSENFNKCKTTLENLEDLSTCLSRPLSIESRDNQSYPELTGGMDGLFVKSGEEDRKAVAKPKTTKPPTPAKPTKISSPDKLEVPRFNLPANTYVNIPMMTQNDPMVPENDLSAADLLEYYEQPSRKVINN
jgi:hypothetical protein